MTRSELAAYLTDTYSAIGEDIFAKYPSFLVFRHSGNKKWVAVIMDIPRRNLGLNGEGEISVVNLKCDPRMIGSFREEPGIFPGWHMNKAHWLSVALDGTVDDEKIKFLVDMSYELTKKRGGKVWHDGIPGGAVTDTARVANFATSTRAMPSGVWTRTWSKRPLSLMRPSPVRKTANIR